MNEQVVLKTNNKHQFLLSAIRSPFEIGAIRPSSSHLAEHMVDASELKPNETIIEAGSGTGIITTEIVSRLPYNCSFTSIEKCPKLASITRKKIQEKAQVIQADICDLQQYDLGSVDCIISSLPMTLWKPNLQRTVIESIHSNLSDNGRMVFFSYITSNIFGGKEKLFQTLSDYFPEIIEYKTVWKNTPPARIYICVKSKSS